MLILIDTFMIRFLSVLTIFINCSYRKIFRDSFHDWPHFTWKACFSRVRLIYTTIIRSIITYDFIIWHASHERSNSVVVATKKLIKLQQQSLRLINDNFKRISMQILETKTHVQLIQLNMTRLQIFFKQRMKKHKHDVLIENFCRQIKHRLFEARRRRRRRTEKTSTARKIKWTQAMHVKLFADERENVAFSNRALIKLFLRVSRSLWTVKWWNMYDLSKSF